ncbi:MAG TPA: gas vesicle protein GvpG [Rhodocyclaceae bacterium]|nr:gas vesicle protein GvpG [Rhodocyclaceae bacterium]
MGLLTNVLLAPVIGPLKGMLWLAGVINDQAERTLYDEDGLRVALMELEQRFETGEIGEEAFEAEEHVLLERLKIARDRARGLG